MSGVFSCRGSYMVCNSVTRRQKDVSTIGRHGYSHNRRSADVSLCQWRLCLFACAGQHSYVTLCDVNILWGWGGVVRLMYVMGGRQYFTLTESSFQ